MAKMTKNVFVTAEYQFITPCESPKNILCSKMLRACKIIAEIMGVV